MTMFFSETEKLFFWVGIIQCNICGLDINNCLVARQDASILGVKTMFLCADCAAKRIKNSGEFTQQIVCSIVNYEDLPEKTYPLTMSIPFFHICTKLEEAKLMNEGRTIDHTKYSRMPSLEGATIGKPIEHIPNPANIALEELGDISEYMKSTKPLLNDTKKRLLE